MKNSDLFTLARFTTPERTESLERAGNVLFGAVLGLVFVIIAAVAVFG